MGLLRGNGGEFIAVHIDRKSRQVAAITDNEVITEVGPTLLRS